MQKNNVKKKKGMKPVYMPHLRGKVVSREAGIRSLKVMGFVVMFIFIYTMLGGALSFDNVYLRVLCNVMMLAAGGVVFYGEGAGHGETDVGFGEIAQKRLDEGKKVDAEDYKLCYHPLKGLYVAALGVLPYFLICLVFSFVAQKQMFSLGVLPSWVTSYESQSEVAQALSYYWETTPLSLESLLRIVVRLINFPYVTMVGVTSYDALYLLDKLSPLLCLTLPLFYVLGYSRGPHLRALVHGNIRMSRRKQAKREQRARQERRQQMAKKSEKKELI